MLDLIDAVTAELLAKASRLQPSDVMVVGAACRDIMHSALGHKHVLRATNDVDVALAIADWVRYGDLISQLVPAGDTGIRFRVAGVPTDIMPFGHVEDPRGSVHPPRRQEAMSVWAFQEVFDASLALHLPNSGIIRIPTVPGYVALKMAAWLDRSAIGEDKDAADIAAALYWYTTSAEVQQLLYETDHGHELLISAEADAELAAAHVLGEHVAILIGPERLTELAARWPGVRGHALYPEMNLVAVPDWTRAAARRQALVAAVERGLRLESAKS